MLKNLISISRVRNEDHIDERFCKVFEAREKFFKLGGS